KPGTRHFGSTTRTRALERLTNRICNRLPNDENAFGRRHRPRETVRRRLHSLRVGGRRNAPPRPPHLRRVRSHRGVRRTRDRKAPRIRGSAPRLRSFLSQARALRPLPNVRRETKGEEITLASPFTTQTNPTTLYVRRSTSYVAYRRSPESSSR